MKSPLFYLLVLFLFITYPNLNSPAYGQHKPVKKARLTAYRKPVSAKKPAPDSRPTLTHSVSAASTVTTLAPPPAVSAVQTTSQPRQSLGLANLLPSGFAQHNKPGNGTNFLDRLSTLKQGDTVKYTRYGMGAVFYLNGGLMATLTRSTANNFGQLGIGAMMSKYPGQKPRYIAALGAGIRLNEQVRVGGQISVSWQKIAAYGLEEKNLTTPGLGLIGIYTPSQKLWLQAIANTNTGTSIGFTYFF